VYRHPISTRKTTISVGVTAVSSVVVAVAVAVAAVAVAKRCSCGVSVPEGQFVAVVKGPNQPSVQWR